FPRGADAHAAKLTDDRVLAMRAAYAQGETIYALCEEHGVTQACAEAAVSGRTWTHVAGPIELRRGHVGANGDRNGRRRKPDSYAHFFGETHPRAKLTAEQVADVRRRLTAGETERSIARSH